MSGEGEAPADSEGKPEESARLMSVDALRSFDMFGIVAGRLLQNKDVESGRWIRVLMIGGLALIGLGMLWGLQYPIVKRIWTSSFVLVASGLSAWVLALFYHVVDVIGWQRWCRPFVWIGCNALVIYRGARVIPFQRIASWFTGGDVSLFLDRGVVEGFGCVVTAVTSLIPVFRFVRFLYKRGIFIRV